MHTDRKSVNENLSNAGEKNNVEEIKPFEIRTTYVKKRPYEGDYFVID